MTLEERPGSESEVELERSGDELEERLDRLDGHIDGAKQELSARSEDTDPLKDTAGDWEDTEDESQGKDATDFDDPDALDDEPEEDEDY